MRRKTRTSIALAVVLLAAAAGFWIMHLHHRPLAEPAVREANGPIFSPGGDRGIEVAAESGAARVWLIADSGKSRTLLLTLNPGESARNVNWSPDGRLAAFESFDEAGHSPMTTTHVWVVDANTRELRELKLPPPNERFSTYFEGWVGNETLKLRATLLERPDDLFFLYSYPAGEMQGPTG